MTTRTRNSRMCKVKAATISATPFVIPSVYVGRLNSMDDWARELSRLYRQMRKGTVPAELGTKLAFVGRIAALATKMSEELRAIEQLRVQLEKIQGNTLPTALPYSPTNGELLPSTLTSDSTDEESQQP
jgi:hypothetical protein